MQLTEEQGRALARYAREVIASALGGPVPVPPSFPGADAAAATFVSLRRGRRLQGCMGSLVAHTSLLDDVAHNAAAAAFVDPRATPLELEDVPALDVEVTVLGPLEPLEARDEQSAIAALRPGVDGVVLTWHGRRGTLLPQVWRDLPDPSEFLENVKIKAGLPPTFWSGDVQLYRYEAHHYDDAAPRAPAAAVATTTA
ncbi:MAG: AmmeMemoRadiSam system protein A [Deltaproteobacteria bacterium]|nr:AmmeMemoRadiSam system protein A [Deltaproteobacteria bacterium]